ncbi:MAG: porin [Gammaproteobacteria bacterium]
MAVTTGYSLVLSSPAAAEGLKAGPLELGGAVRMNLIDKSWETRQQRFSRADLEFDTLRGELRLNADRWSGSAQYRLYYYDETDRVTHFLHHAWLGYEPDDHSRIKAGIHKVPFGNLPFNSNSYFFSLAYYVGLEDDYDLGLKYTRSMGPWRWDAAYYIADEGSYFGDSDDSARYSYDVVKSPNSANHEEHQINTRLSYSFDHGRDADSELGVSLQAGRIPNDAGGTGSHLAAAVHWNGDFGAWNVKVQSLWYRYNLANPPGRDNRIVVMGAYDFPYNVAAEGHMHTLGISYDWNIDYGWLQGITIYNDYSYFVKAKDDFSDSHQNVAGMAFDVSPFHIYADIAVGKHNAWIGPDFSNALTDGGNDDKFHTRLNLNIGLYF